MSTVQHKILTKTAEAPAAVLGKAVMAGQVVRNVSVNNVVVRKTKDYWLMLGPGLTTGASDDDPSGIATYTQAGAKYGFDLLWMAPWTFPLMATVQEMCARIGLVTGRGLAGNIRVFFNKRLLYICTALLFGTLPALRASRLQLVESLKSGRGASNSASRSPLPSTLIVPLVWPAGIVSVPEVAW